MPSGIISFHSTVRPANDAANPCAAHTPNSAAVVWRLNNNQWGNGRCIIKDCAHEENQVSGVGA
jgi:hypothetical protein